MSIAALEPRINYSPRVPNWRIERQINPQKYWWQGLSDDRFSDAVIEFVESGNDSRHILTRDEFSERYKSLYRSGTKSKQQALGLAANSLYGFTPATRPVYWRLLIIQSRLYHAFMKISLDDMDKPVTSQNIASLFALSPEDEFPFGKVSLECERFEPFSATLKASTEYINYLVIPKLELSLRAS